MRKLLEKLRRMAINAKMRKFENAQVVGKLPRYGNKCENAKIRKCASCGKAPQADNSLGV